ncbi:hypothetical protein C8A00DRAFT_19071 [Chaetomidium leptoderma]|uniref:Uncharacterized protein n=1 Tax=Chaetomidium leptoderma TaxID=669021 RepID=A0AAN6ZSF0_9PEZI|nr:hypothetical protein C8A00DRAFT_19071 [Chaetomidium leptoderma]
MNGPFRVEGGPVRLTLQQIMDEFISQRVKRWKAKQVNVPNRELAARIAAMCWDYDSLPGLGPGCLLPDHKGDYVYIPYDDSRDDLPPDPEDRMAMADHWFTNPANTKLLQQADKMLEKQVNDKCFWEFLDGGSAARLDFHGKWRTLPWSCAENAVVRCLEAFSRPLFTPESTLATHLKRLEIIHGPEDAAKEAQDLANELNSQRPLKDDPEWFYFLCGVNDATVPMEERDWQPLRRMPNDFKIMKRNSREVGKWPIIVRSRLLRHYKLCLRVHNLQKRQLEHGKEMGKAAVLGIGGDTGKPYFNEG